MNAVKLSTADQLRISVRLFERWHGGPVMLGTVDELLVSRFLSAYETTPLHRTSKPPSPKTVQGKRSDILGVWRHAWNTHYVAQCP